MHSENAVLRPAPVLRALAKRCWEQITRPARDRIVGQFRRGYWWADWEEGKLRIKRQFTEPPSTAFAGGHGSSAAPSLGAPIIEYDGEAITATGLKDNDPTLGGVADTMVELAKLLNERCRQSRWACVVVSGAPKAVQKLKERLNRDQNAPLVYDVDAAAALERSRGERR